MKTVFKIFMVLNYGLVIYGIISYFLGGINAEAETIRQAIFNLIIWYGLRIALLVVCLHLGYILVGKLW